MQSVNMMRSKTFSSAAVQQQVGLPAIQRARLTSKPAAVAGAPAPVQEQQKAPFQLPVVFVSTEVGWAMADGDG